MFSIEDQLTQLYVFVDDFCRSRPDLAAWRQSPHQQPAFSDAEVLTIALMQSWLEVASLKQTYRLVIANCRPAFPQVCSYPQWIARVHTLGRLLEALLCALTNFRTGGARFLPHRCQNHPRLPADPAPARPLAARRRGVVWQNQQGLV